MVYPSLRVKELCLVVAVGLVATLAACSSSSGSASSGSNAPSTSSGDSERERQQRRPIGAARLSILRGHSRYRFRRHSDRASLQHPPLRAL